MSRRLRYIPEGSVVEVTMRTIQSRFLLRPSPEVNDVILGIIGRAQGLYEVQLHAFAFLSNHFHILLSPPDAKSLSSFMNYINSNIAREVGLLHDWTEKIWGRRYQGILVAEDEASQLARLRYILSHGCKEGLVARPAEWPGVHCVAALTEGAPLVGTWLDRTAAHEASRRKAKRDESTFCTEYTVTLTPLPCLAGMSPQAYRQYCVALVADIERETALLNAEHGRQPLGRAAVLRQHPHDRPQSTKRGPAPLVHAVTRAARERFLVAYRWFVDRYQAAAECLRQGGRDVLFPVGAFPAPAPFVTGDQCGARALAPPG